jgi:tripartite tricarboxylate transporter family receptor
VPVGVLGTVPLFIVVNGKLPAKNLQEFVAYAKANKLTYGSAGVGTTPHLAADAFVRRAGLDMVHVPYRGSAPAVTDVIGGNIPMTFVSMGPHMQFVQSGAIRVLAVATAKRVPYLPDVPTFAEQDFPRLRGRHLVRGVRAARHAEGDRGEAQRLGAQAASPGVDRPGETTYIRLVRARTTTLRNACHAACPAPVGDRPMVGQRTLTPLI